MQKKTGFMYGVFFTRTIYFLLAAFVLVLTLPCFSQVPDSTDGNWGLELSVNYGFVIAHRPMLVPLNQEHVRGIEMSWIKTSSGKKNWEESFLYPDRGITVMLLDLGSPDHLGKGIVVYPFYDFPLGHAPDWQLHIRYGIGLGYVEKVFNPGDNFQNAAIGSHMNGVFHLDMHFQKAFSERTFIESGIGITHYSNGSISMPNLGINIATAHLGIQSYFGQKKARVHRTPEAFNKKAGLQMYFAAAMKKINPPRGPYYTAGTFSIIRMKPLSTKCAWGIGADLFYDQSVVERLEQKGTKISNQDNFRPGVYGAFELLVGKLGLSFNMGFYPYTKLKDDGAIYHRIGLHYYFKNFFLCSNLKTHYARADFVEWGIGWRFNNM